MMENEWRTPRIVDGYFINEKELIHKCESILVTYETLKGRRYTKQVLCDHGRVSKQVNGDVVAWMPLPRPYKGDVS